MKRLVVILVLLALFIGMTAGAAIVSNNIITDFAQEKNAEKTAMVQHRLDETIALLTQLSEDEYIRDPDIPFIEKAQVLTQMNIDENLGYMMVRILDEEINIYREGVGASSNLATRDYMQKMYATGEGQVTDAFLAGADGKTINYTVTHPIIQDGQVTSSLMAAIYGTQIDEYLQDPDSNNILVGSQLQYMGGIPEEQFGMAVAQVLESELETSRPVENILLDFYEKRSGSFWGVGNGIQYFTYSPMNNCSWVVMTEVQALPMVSNILITYACGMALLIAAGIVAISRTRPKKEASEDENT